MAEIVPIPILLISHDGLAAALVRASDMIMGGQENIGVVGLEEGDGLSNFISKVQQGIAELKGTEKGIIFLVDIPFGTPWNASVAVKRETDHIVAGVSLPFLLEVLNYRSQYDEIEKILKDSLAVKEQCFRYLGLLEH
ncbi:MAG: PTS sugar transporter subunit IIA [Anaerolineaceae bacterium]|jgi:mannose/fructose/sorbose-specific phosphotransferase system IIA component|nr:MAG: PTS sugar transporter subunit IIA [Anaerolineaceae bacterium]